MDAPYSKFSQPRQWDVHWQDADLLDNYGHRKCAHEYKRPRISYSLLTKRPTYSSTSHRIPLLVMFSYKIVAVLATIAAVCVGVQAEGTLIVRQKSSLSNRSPPRSA